MACDIIEISPDEDFLIYFLVLWLKQNFDMRNPSTPRINRYVFRDLEKDLEYTYPAYKKFQEDLYRETVSKRREGKLQKIRGKKLIRIWEYESSYELANKIRERQETKTERRAVMKQFAKYRSNVPQVKKLAVVEAGAERNYTVAEVFPEYVGKDKPVAIRAYRSRENLTQRQLAELTGIPQRHISEMENGKRVIGKEMAKRLSKVLKADYKMFL